MGLLAAMVQAGAAARRQIGVLDARVRTLIELREAGAFGTGGFGGDKPVGEEHFSLETLAKVRSIPSAGHISKLEEYVYAPQIDPGKPNAYAMIIGLQPASALRAIGEVDYENARLLAGRSFQEADRNAAVAVVGRLYATQRLGLVEYTDTALAEARLVLQGQPLKVIGVYTTENDFGDNHVFIPLEMFRRVFRPGAKLSKIFVTADSVGTVEQLVAELKTIPEADVVTAPEAVSTARQTLGSLAATTAYGAALLFALGGALVVGTMVLATHERVREIGTLKALGAPSAAIIGQMVAEAFALTAMGGAGALVVAVAARPVVRATLGLSVSVEAQLFLLVLAGAVIFGAIGSLYPIFRAVRLSPVEAMQKG
jgi:ABC-type antimicrobial peptide transport system permease subunit